MIVVLDAPAELDRSYTSGLLICLISPGGQPALKRTHVVDNAIYVRYESCRYSGDLLTAHFSSFVGILGEAFSLVQSTSGLYTRRSARLTSSVIPAFSTSSPEYVQSTSLCDACVISVAPLRASRTNPHITTLQEWQHQVAKFYRIQSRLHTFDLTSLQIVAGRGNSRVLSGQHLHIDG